MAMEASPSHSRSPVSWCSPTPTRANTAPETKMNTAARNAQKKRSLPYPKGCSSSGVRSPSDSETSRNTWFMVSATEWAASASIAGERPIRPAAALATAMAKLAAIAARIVFLLSLCIPAAFRLVSAGTRVGARRGAVAGRLTDVPGCWPAQHPARQQPTGQAGQRGGPGSRRDAEQQRDHRQHHHEGRVVEALDRRAPGAPAGQQAGGRDG